MKTPNLKLPEALRQEVDINLIFKLVIGLLTFITLVFVYQNILKPLLQFTGVGGGQSDVEKDLEKDLEKEINVGKQNGQVPMKYNDVLTPLQIKKDAVTLANLFSTNNAGGTFGWVTQSEEKEAVDLVIGYGAYAFSLLEKAYASPAVTSRYVGTRRGLKADFKQFVDKYTLEPISLLINS